jgi:hypothetical protein
LKERQQIRVHLILVGRAAVLIRAFKSATSRSTWSTYQNAWLALEVPALGVGYRKHAVRSADS